VRKWGGEGGDYTGGLYPTKGGIKWGKWEGEGGKKTEGPALSKKRSLGLYGGGRKSPGLEKKVRTEKELAKHRKVGGVRSGRAKSKRPARGGNQGVKKTLGGEEACMGWRGMAVSAATKKKYAES